MQGGQGAPAILSHSGRPQGKVQFELKPERGGEGRQGFTEGRASQEEGRARAKAWREEQPRLGRKISEEASVARAEQRGGREVRCRPGRW